MDPLQNKRPAPPLSSEEKITSSSSGSSDSGNKVEIVARETPFGNTGEEVEREGGQISAQVANSSMRHEEVIDISNVAIPNSLYISGNDDKFTMYDSPIWVDIENLSSDAEKAVQKEMCNAPGVSFLSRVKELYPKLKKFYICSDYSMQQCHAYSIGSNEREVIPPIQGEKENIVFYHEKDRRNIFNLGVFVNDVLKEPSIDLDGLANLMLDKGILERINHLYYAVNSNDLIENIYDVMVEGNINIPNFDPEKKLMANDFLFEIFECIEESAIGYPALAHTAIKIKDNIVAGKVLGGPVIVHRAADLLGESYQTMRGLE